MRLRLVCIALVLVACEPIEITKDPDEAPAALDPSEIEFVPCVRVPPDQSTKHARTHPGPLMGPTYRPIDANTAHIMAPEGLSSDPVNFWGIELIDISDGGESELATVTTQPPSMGGLDLEPLKWFEISHPPNAIGWRSLLVLRMTPHGVPPSPAIVVCLPNASIVP